MVALQPIGNTVFPMAAASLAMADQGTLADIVNAAPLDQSAVSARRGYNLDAPFRLYSVEPSGRVTIFGEEVDLFEVRLGQAEAQTYSGYLRVGRDLTALPIGSRLDATTGVFSWQPGVGFLHTYDLVFVRWQDGRAVSRQEVRFELGPKRSELVGPQMVIDTPRAQADVAQPFVAAGWSVDLGALSGTGVSTIHVWAYPLTGGSPVFVGVASIGGQRPDVGAIYGDRFGTSGFGVVVDGLAPGNYDLALFPWSTASNGFLPAKTVRLTIR